MKLRDCWNLLKATGQEWVKDKVPRLGAALAYYTALSIAPLVVIIIAIAGLAYGQRAAQHQLNTQIQEWVGHDAAMAIQAMIKHSRSVAEGVIAGGVGVVMLLLGASGVFSELQDSLNTIWEVQPKPGRGILGMLKDRFLSFAMVLGIGFLLLVSLVITSALSAIGAYIAGLFADIASVLQVVTFFVSVGVILLLFALIFKYLPDAKIAWKDGWMGAGLTALLFVLGKYLLGVYLAHSGIASTYGATGSFVVLLVWVYYSAQILYFGAEFTKVYANKVGSRIVPAKDAQPATAEARAHQGLSRKKGAEEAARK
jgi:membrane protein